MVPRETLALPTGRLSRVYACAQDPSTSRCSSPGHSWLGAPGDLGGRRNGLSTEHPSPAATNLRAPCALLAAGFPALPWLRPRVRESLGGICLSCPPPRETSSRRSRGGDGGQQMPRTSQSHGLVTQIWPLLPRPFQKMRHQPGPPTPIPDARPGPRQHRPGGAVPSQREIPEWHVP